MTLAESLPDPLVTARLTLARLREADAEEMVGVLSDPALYTVIGGEPPTLDGLRRRYAALVVGHSPDGTEEWLNWVVRERAGGVAVGTMQATGTGSGSRADVAWVVGAAWQRRGYAAEAAGAMVDALVAAGVGVITAHVAPGHVASEAVARACGLAPTEAFHDGERRWERRSG